MKYFMVKVRTESMGQITEHFEMGTGMYAVPKLYKKGNAVSLARQRINENEYCKVTAWVVPVTIIEEGRIDV